MNLSKRVFVLAAALFLLSPSAFCLISDRLAFEPGELREGTEKDFFSDLDNGTLKRFSLYDAFLIASGITDPADFALYQQKLYSIKNRALDGVRRDPDPYVTAKALLLWLHDNVLKHYKADATLASDIIDRGDFNCLSSSILYALLAADLGLDVHGVIVKDHAFCILIDSRGDKDIETTIRYGFDPGRKEIEQLKEFTRYVYVPKKDYSLRRVVNVYQLVGAMYSNLVNVLSHTETQALDYKAQLPKYKKGFYFDQDSEIFTTDVRACLNNLALREMEKSNFDEAYGYIRQALKFDPANEDFKNLEMKYFSDRGIAELKEGNYEKAIGYMKIGVQKYPDNEKLLNNLAFCYISWGNSFFEKKDFEGAAIVFEQGLASVPGDETLRSNLKASIYNLAVREYRRRDYLKAIHYADRGLKFFPNDKNFLEVKQASEGMY